MRVPINGRPSGACAAMVAAFRRGLVDRKVTVEADGGELVIEWRESDGHMLMTGPATLAFKGDVDLKDAMPVRIMNTDNSAVRARQDGN